MIHLTMDNEAQSTIPSIEPLPQTTSPILISPPSKWLKILLFTSLGIFALAGATYTGTQIEKSNRFYNDKPLIPTPTVSLLTNNVEWKIITSDKAKFSFKYPSSWPIAFEPEEQLDQDNLEYDETNNDLTQIRKNIFKVEGIDFAQKWERGMSNNEYGYIYVEKQTGINSLDDYIKYYDTESEIWGKGQTAKIPRPIIKYSVIAGEVAVSFYNQDINLANWSSAATELEYRIFKNGLMYYFVPSRSDLFMQNKDINAQIFREIVDSVKFQD